MRKVLFWSHLTIGVATGLIVFMMCVTGFLLTFERQTIDWADRAAARATPPPGAARLPLSELIAKAGKPPAGITVHSDPAEPVELAMGKQGTVYLNPYTGEIAGHPSERAHKFFESVRAWHRWVALGPAAQKATVPVYDAANLILLVVVITGPFLWWPKKLTRQHLRPIVWFRGGLSGKARDFNWHNAIGLWSSIPMLLIVATGVVLSYDWGTNLLYRITGTQQPDFAAAARDRSGRGLPPWQGVDGWLAAGEARMPAWRTITMRNTPARTVAVGLDSGTGGQPQKRYTLTIDRVTGSEVKFEPFTQNNFGFQLRLLARFVHTGEVGGAWLQAFAGLISLGGAFLVYTGFALSLRRFASWRRRRKARTGVAEPAAVA